MSSKDSSRLASSRRRSRAASGNLGDFDETDVHLGRGHEFQIWIPLAVPQNFPISDFRKLVNSWLPGLSWPDGYQAEVDESPLIGGHFLHFHHLQGLVADVDTDRQRPLEGGGQRRKRFCPFLRHDRLVGGLFIGSRRRLASYDVEKLFRGRNLSIRGHAHFLYEKVPAVRNQASLPAVRCHWNRIPRNPHRERVSRKCPKIANDNKQLHKKENPLKPLSISAGCQAFLGNSNQRNDCTICAIKQTLTREQGLAMHGPIPVRHDGCPDPTAAVIREKSRERGIVQALPAN